MAIDGLASSGSGVEHAGSTTSRAKDAMMATNRMMVTTVMASVLLVVVVMMVLTMGTMNGSPNDVTARNGTRAGVASPLATAVGIVEQ